MAVKPFSLLLLLAFLASCSSKNILVEGSLPVPMVKKIPAAVGIYYSEEFVSFRYKEISPEIGNWDIDFGGQNARFFRLLFDSMFEKTENIDRRDISNENSGGFDGFLIPKIKKYGFLTPFVSGLGFYSASIEYELSLYDSDASVILTWKVVGYGKNEGGVFGKEEAIERATLLAIRDAGAKIAIELGKRAEIESWLKDKMGG